MDAKKTGYLLEYNEMEINLSFFRKNYLYGIKDCYLNPETVETLEENIDNILQVIDVSQNFSNRPEAMNCTRAGTRE